MQVDVTQGSEKWLALRRTKVSATDTSSILGLNPYRSMIECFWEKTGLSEVIVNDAMRRGSELEPLARQMFIDQIKIDVKPAVFISDKYPWMMCSLDGLSNDHQIAVEIKCGSSAYKTALQGNIPVYYKIQMYHQMIVMDIDTMFYQAWDGKEDHEPIIIQVDLDHSYISKIISETKKFHDDVINLSIPQPVYEDIWAIEQKEWDARLERTWRSINEDNGITNMFDGFASV